MNIYLNIPCAVFSPVYIFPHLILNKVIKGHSDRLYFADEEMKASGISHLHMSHNW